MNTSKKSTSPKSKTTAGAKPSAAEQVQSKAARATRTTRAAARDIASSAAEQVQAQADAAKDTMAENVSGVATALRNAAQEMRSGSPQERTIGQIAESLADASDAVRDKDLGEIVRDASDLARRNPLVFLGGAALLGFAATRFVKASRPIPALADHRPQNTQARIAKPAGTSSQKGKAS